MGSLYVEGHNLLPQQQPHLSVGLLNAVHFHRQLAKLRDTQRLLAGRLPGQQLSG